MNKEIACRINTVSEPRTTSKGDVLDVFVTELSTNKEYRIGCFLNEAEWVFNNGDEVVMAIKQGQPYKGKPTFSCGVANVRPLVDLNAPKAEVKAPPPPEKKIELPKPEAKPDKIDEYLTYRQRVQEMLELFKTQGITDGTCISSAILGIREMMGRERI